MLYLVKTFNPGTQQSGCLIVGAFEDGQLSDTAKQIDKLSHGYLRKILRRGDFTGKFGQSIMLQDVPHIPAERILLLGCGKKPEFTEQHYRKIVLRAISLTNATRALEAVSFLTELPVAGQDEAWKIKQTVECAEDALYTFTQLKTKKDKQPRPLKKIILHNDNKKTLASCKIAVEQGLAIANGMKFARDLGNLPANLCTPSYLAKEALLLAKQHKNIKTHIIDLNGMKKLGMGALMAVAQGSQEPAKLITLEYQGGKKTEKPIVLVGKGVTFDSGGISIKPAAAMDEMKYDMCGAASVLGTIKAIAELNLAINVVGVIPATENMPSGQATKPGDIITTMSGQTVEILNTDAEGRLILCDALTYCAKFKPEVVIDIATLTGAIIIALGTHVSGLMTNNESLANDLLKASKVSCDRVWQMPLWEEYQDALSSNFADMANIGGREAGSLTAASFLARFTKEYKWAHLDIAGTAWRSGKDKGATGRPIPLLVQYLLDKS